jgi:CRISPR-associated endonuclease/helicase Cas3
VDQATNEAINLKQYYPDSDIAVSPLRGSLADNQDWKRDPTRPTIIVGTPDMVASKLLFGGYGDGKYFRPIHAGILGNGTLFVVDEAHLCEPLCNTLNTIQSLQTAEQNNSQSHDWFQPINLVQLTATWSGGEHEKFGLDTEDEQHPIIRQRLDAVKKAIIGLPVKRDQKAVCGQVILKAEKFADKRERVIVYLYDPRYAVAVYKSLDKKYKNRVALLTGTIRGYERDKLIASNEIIKKFAAGTKYKPEDLTETVYLVATSAGEIGWDIDSDHMVCDVSPLDSMIQRLGRLNRYGNRRDSTVTIIFGESGKDEIKGFEAICKNTYLALTAEATCKDGELTIESLSPSFLSKFHDKQYDKCRSKKAITVELEDRVMNAWSMTSINDDLPLKISLDQYIHGIQEESPDAYVAWRSEVGTLNTNNIDLDRWFSQCRLLPHELLQDRAETVGRFLTSMAKDFGDRQIIVVHDNKYEFMSLSDAAIADPAYHTFILPEDIGGINENGSLDAACRYEKSTHKIDIAEIEPYTSRKRLLITESKQFGFAPFAETETTFVRGPRQVVNRFFGDECELQLISNKGDISQATLSNRQRVLVDDHNNKVADFAGVLCEKLNIPFGREFMLAGKYHDLGKICEKWQRAIYNHNWQTLGALAKSTCGMDISQLGTKQDGYYRHELESLKRLLSEDQHVAELVCYLVWSHHGHGRPHFRPGAGTKSEIMDGIPGLFDKVQNMFGRWGLAYLHAIFCMSDIEASK